MKKITSILLAVIIAFSVITIAPFAVSASEIFGDYQCDKSYYSNGKYYYSILKYSGNDTNIVIPSNFNGIPVKSVEGFENCKKIESVVIPDSVEIIGINAFKDCLSLKTVSMGKNITIISTNAFRNCQSLKSITLPENLRSISSSGAFYGCINLTTLNFNIRSLDDWGNIGSLEYAMEDLTKIKNLNIGYTVEELNSTYFSGFSELETLNIENGLMVIPADSFKDCVNLKTVNLPDSIMAIGASAFKNCESIENIDLPNNLGIISNETFYNCTSLKEITIPSSVRKIEPYAFANCVALNKINFENGANSIGDYAFANCTQLTTVHFPTTVSEIGKGIFENCKNISQVTLPGKVETINDYMFEDCINIKSIVIPDNIKNIGSSAFANCKNLSYVKIGKGVKTISSAAFENCLSLKNIEIPGNVEEIESAAFQGCKNLSNVQLNEGLEDLGANAFYNCVNLKGITFPKSIYSIGNYAVGYYGHEYNNYQITDFYIRGYFNSEAYYYAQENEFDFIDLEPKPESVTLSNYSVTIGAGEVYYIKPQVYPSNAVTELTWSSNSYYLVVDEGYIYSLYPGTYYVTVSTSNGKSATCRVTVKPAPASVKTNPTSVTLGVGETYTISESTNSGSYANAANLKWSSSNNSVATVTKGSGNKATIKATGVGTAYVKITLYNGKTATCKVTVKSAPASVKTNPTSVTLGKGEYYTISESTNSGSYANAANLKWSSSNNSVATVTKGSGNKATIKATGVGTAYVKITLYNGKTATCKVTVKSAPASVITNPTSVTLGKGEYYTISESTNSGSYANAANLKWSSSNNSVATVTKGSGNKATIKAKGIGTAYVKITLYNGKTATCKVTVKSAPASVKTNPTSVTLGVGETYTISESTNSGSYANAANLKWSSSNNSVATVTKGSGNKAVITAKSKGTAYVKIVLFNGKTAQCKVTVK